MVNKKAISISAAVIGSIAGLGYLYVDNYQGEKVAHEFQYQGLPAHILQREMRLGFDEYIMFLGNPEQSPRFKGQGARGGVQRLCDLR
ncbi:hypothetical protein HY494_01865 [Candidatus Woesearchaeota archaeon]|nr:hypothetical protein [Candidatus Woesearchaeota archaeon]